MLNFLNNNENDVKSNIKSISVNKNDFESLSTKIELLMILKLTEKYFERLFSEWFLCCTCFSVVEVLSDREDIDLMSTNFDC